ncbi:MAG: DUF1559 domain-containing protein [Planctomycetaceae bacterium]
MTLRNVLRRQCDSNCHSLRKVACPAQGAAIASTRHLRRAAFTQVEFLVTIALIFMLVSLILPVIAKTRDVVRGSQCKDHLHNLGIAVENYVNSFGQFPAGSLVNTRPVKSVPGGDGFSWLVRLLPFVEQKPLYDTIDWSLPLEQQQRAPRLSIWIDLFRCPAADVDLNRQPAISTYAGSHHSREAPIDIDNNGLFLLGRGIQPVDVTDGLSHTLLVSEKGTPADDQGWAAGGRATLRNTGQSFARLDTDRPNSDPLYVGGFVSAHARGVHVTLADGATRLMSFDADHTLLQRLANRRDGELISAAELTPEQFPQSSDGNGGQP